MQGEEIRGGGEMRNREWGSAGRGEKKKTEARTGVGGE